MDRTDRILHVSGGARISLALAESPPEVPDHERIRRLLAAARRSAEPLRNTALVYVMLGTGLAQIEVALLRVSDYLNEDGSVRRVSEVRQEAAKIRRARKMYWVNPRVCQAIDAYLKQRVLMGYGVTGRAVYRGLDPDSALFLTDVGHPMCVRQRPSATGSRRRCSTIQDIFRRLYTAAGLKNDSARDGRRRVARALYQLGADVEGIRDVLGMSKPREVRRMLGQCDDALSPADRLTGLMERVI